MTATADITADGWYRGADKRSSPHFNERPAGALVSLVVLHFISLPPGVFSGEDVDALFRGTLDTQKHPFYRDLEGLRVSSHFVIRRTGEVRAQRRVLPAARRRAARAARVLLSTLPG